ncbi:MAG TPA: hypothetical protein VLT33_47670 [Labilithrix sp.]|nr:hypothetical protein [Labilithrix sp.]
MQRFLLALFLFASFDLACSSTTTTTTSSPQPSAEDAAAPTDTPDAEAPPASDAGKDAAAESGSGPAQLVTGLSDKSCKESCAATGLTCATTCEVVSVDERLSNDAPYAGYGEYQKIAEPVTALPRTRGEHSCDAPIEKYWTHGGEDWRLQLYSSATPRVTCCCR